VGAGAINKGESLPPELGRARIFTSYI